MPRLPEERFSFFSHLFGAVAALGGVLVLALRSQTPEILAVSLVYGLSMTFMFSASALYHAFKTEEKGNGFWRRLDHLAIFFMIAGSYTPICYLHLTGSWRWGILGLQWGLVLLGVLFKLLFIRAPRAVTTVIYLAMGWIVLIPLSRLLASVTTFNLELIFLGGVAYSLGALFYAVKRPNPAPGVFGFHEVFHVMVLLGAGVHFWAIFRMVG